MTTDLSKKRALLIGLNYRLDPINTLYGCVNDIKNIANFLETKKGFKKENIKVITDEDPYTILGTLRSGMLKEIDKLRKLSWTEKLDVVYFHYSGHGTQTADLNGDEKDGLDECIVPNDSTINGVITDDELNNMFINFNPETKIFSVFDSCHSGSVLDLDYEFIDNIAKKVKTNSTSTRPLSLQPQIYCISGCLDSQTSADAFNEQTAKYGGALTDALLKTMIEYNDKHLSFFDLVKNVNIELQKNQFTQITLLSMSHSIDKDTMFDI